MFVEVKGRDIWVNRNLIEVIEVKEEGSFMCVVVYMTSGDSFTVARYTFREDAVEFAKNLTGEKYESVRNT